MAAGCRGGRSAPLVLRTASNRDLAAADGILRAAFDAHTRRPGTLGDTEYLRNRSRSDAGRVVVAVARGEVVVSSARTVWGSVGWFGPLSVAPAMQRPGSEVVTERLQVRIKHSDCDLTGVTIVNQGRGAVRGDP